MTDAKAWERHWTKQIEERDATIKELVGLLGRARAELRKVYSRRFPTIWEIDAFLAKHGGKND